VTATYRTRARLFRLGGRAAAGEGAAWDGRRVEEEEEVVVVVVVVVVAAAAAAA
jgi:hypothetical protein